MDTPGVRQETTEICTQCGKSFPSDTGVCPEDGTQLLATISDPLVGTMLPRNYKIISLLGRGSMSVVYKGFYEPLKQTVAVKLLKSHLVSDPHQAKRFQQEIQTAGALNHPNIVGILDFAVTEQGVPYLIMEYLEGQSLSEVITTDGQISVNRSIKIFTQCADALAYAHNAGVIHRDIKPSNIVIVHTEEEKDIVKVVDFGIAKVLRHSDGEPSAGIISLTATGEVLGTPLYMSPEQACGVELDKRSDIYSLGCVMYHAITGKPPFVGDTAIDTIRLQTSAEPQSIEKARPDLYIPERLQGIIMRCLDKDREERFQDMEEVREQLQKCIRKPELTASVTTRAIRISQTAKLDAQQPPAVKVPRAKAFPILPVMFGALVVIGVGLGVALWHHDEPAVIHNPAVTPSPERWTATMKNAHASYDAGNYTQAEKEAKEALLITKHFKGDDVRTADTLNVLSSISYAQDKLDDAKRLNERALAILQTNGGDQGQQLNVLINLSKISSAQDDHKQAEAYAKQALALSKQMKDGVPEAETASLQCLASVYCARSQYRKADQQLTKALSLAEKSIGKDSLATASVAHDLGMVREKQGKNKSAEQLLNRALSIRQKQLGESNPAIADTLCALGALEFNMRQDKSAEMMFNSALAIRQKAYGEQSLRVAEVYSCLARFYESQSDADNADEAYRKTLSIRQNVWGDESPKLLKTLKPFESFLRKSGKKEELAEIQQHIKLINTATN